MFHKSQMFGSPSLMNMGFWFLGGILYFEDILIILLDFQFFEPTPINKHIVRISVFVCCICFVFPTWKEQSTKYKFLHIINNNLALWTSRNMHWNPRFKIKNLKKFWGQCLVCEETWIRLAQRQASFSTSLFNISSSICMHLSFSISQYIFSFNLFSPLPQ